MIIEGKTVLQLQKEGILLVEDGNHGENRPLQHEFGPEGVPFVRPPDLVNGRVAFENCDRINSEARRRVRKGIGIGGDILFTHRATVGRIAIAENDAPEFVANPGVTIWRCLDGNVIDRRFLYYWMQTKTFMDQVWALSGGTDTFPYISLNQQRTLKITLPGIDRQRQISKLLGSLSDKIELNRRTSETLEAMAQAIFRDWFVDFGPTRRKVDGATEPVEIMGGLVTDPDRARKLADLFPARLADDELPTGWGAGRLDDVLELAYGKSLTKEDRRDGPYPVYGSGGIGGWHDSALVKGPSVVVGRKGTVGSLYWEDRDFYPIDTVFFVRSRLPMTFCYYLLQTLGLEHMNTDAAVPGLNRNNAYRLDVPMPKPEVIDAFHARVELLRQKIAANASEITTVVATRDLLLPKLMSGELRLREVEEELEAAQ